MAGDDKVKETILTITFRDNANKLLDSSNGITNAMAQCLFELGCLDYMEHETNSNTYVLKWGEQSLNTDDSEIVKFAQAICPDLNIIKSKIMTHRFNSSDNEDVILNLMPDKVLELQHSFARTHVALISTNYISIRTYGDAPKSSIDAFHRKNVLAIKDMVIATSVVLNSEYTCTYKVLPNSECKV